MSGAEYGELIADVSGPGHQARANNGGGGNEPGGGSHTANDDTPRPGHNRPPETWGEKIRRILVRFGRGAGRLGGVVGLALQPGGSSCRTCDSVSPPGIDDVISNPGILEGLTGSQGAQVIGNPEGWRVERLGQGGHRGQGWMVREYTPQGHTTGRQIRWHPGGGHHGPSPYWLVNDGHTNVRVGAGAWQ